MPFGAAGCVAGIIVMADDVIAIQLQLTAKPGYQSYKRVVCSIGKFTRAVRVTAFDRDGGVVTILGANCPCHLVEGDALDDLALKTNDEMSTCAGLVVFEMSPVLIGSGFRIGNVVYNDVFYAPKLIPRTGIVVDGKIATVDEICHCLIADVKSTG